MKTRLENDLLGSVEVPQEALYGAQSQRALEIYPLAGEKRFSDYPELLKAMLLVKKSCTMANQRAGLLENSIAAGIASTIDSLLDSIPSDQFAVHAFHGGGGISFNMNINEVIANLSNQAVFGASLGSYEPVHPNNHVNLNQSTSDVFTTASHVAIIHSFEPLNHELEKLSEVFDRLGEKWKMAQKISRTCLQDAVEISFSDFLSGYRDLVAREQDLLANAVSELYTVNLGGTIVGRACDADEAYRKEIMSALVDVLDESRFKQSTNLFDSAQNLDVMGGVVARIRLLAKSLIKLGKDFRLLSSGPQTGFGEIVLPAVQPGSSALPGKVNPTIPEFLIQCCFQVVGRCTSAEMVLDHGELDLNVWGAVMITNLLDAIRCLENGIKVFRVHCLDGLEINHERNAQNVQTIIPIMTRIKLEKGYSFAVDLFKKTKGDLEQIKRVMKEKT